jgi:protein TonB
MNKYIIFLALACLALGACDNKPKPKQEQMLMVSLPPPPPPPKPKPTPPPVEQPPEQKVQEKQTIDPDPKPQMAKPEPPKPDEPPAGLGSNIKGDPDGFGLSGSSNDGIIGGTGRGKGGGNPAGYYAGQVQGWIAEALRQDKRTRAANLSARVKLWIDESGKITRVEPGSGGNVATLESVLVGMRLPVRPPEGKTMTVTYNIAARQP